MLHRTVTVGSAVGLHARPAALIAQAADELTEEVWLARAGQPPVDASSALLVMSLGAGFGDVVEVSSPSQEAVDAIAELVTRDLDI